MIFQKIVTIIERNNFSVTTDIRSHCGAIESCVQRKQRNIYLLECKNNKVVGMSGREKIEISKIELKK